MADNFQYGTNEQPDSYDFKIWPKVPYAPYMGQDLICTVTHLPKRGAHFRPQYVLDGKGGVKPIPDAETVFPSRGCIFVPYNERLKDQEPIMLLRITKKLYDPPKAGREDLQVGKCGENIEVRSVEKADGLYTYLEWPFSFNELKKTWTLENCNVSGMPAGNGVFIRDNSKDSDLVYGPFDSMGKDGGVLLNAQRCFEYHIGLYPKDSVKRHPLREALGDRVSVCFTTMEGLTPPHERATGQKTLVLNPKYIAALVDTTRDVLQRTISERNELKSANDDARAENTALQRQLDEQREYQERKDGHASELKILADEYRSSARECARLFFERALLEELTKEKEEEPPQLEPLGVRTYGLFAADPYDIVGQDIIDAVQAFLKQTGRDLSNDTVANYLICLTQGFITTFAGRPGSGKTSLCNLLAKALGLDPGPKQGVEKRFIDVAVNRGWATCKDFIGYYNPLSDRMVKSNAPVYDALVRISKEEQKVSTPPMVILLDEANLSPIEHYWSIFLKNSDMDETRTRSFNLGGKEVFNIPPYLRFLATVNFDHTTEELSPRFLDRTWLIMLDDAPDGEYTDGGTMGEIPGAITYRGLKKAFKPEEKLTMPKQLRSIWTEFRKVMSGKRKAIMPRAGKMVEDYVKVAAVYMEDAYAPLDYALSQKILPSFSGEGKEYADLLEQLIRLCEKPKQDGSEGEPVIRLPRTRQILADMLAAGAKNMDMYNFFAR